MQRQKLSWMLACCGASLIACRSAAPDDTLFPLAAGHEWNYRISTEREDGQAEREALTLRTLSPGAPAGLEGEKSAWHRRSDSGAEYWLRADATGVYRVASKHDLEAKAQLDKPARYVPKAPYIVGTQWQTTTVPYLLMRHSEFPRELRHTHKNVVMNHQIEATDDKLDTPSGHFEKCLRVKGAASVRVYADPTSGWRDVPITTLEWYCPGVGLARLERREPANSSFLTGGTLTMELESWK